MRLVSKLAREHVIDQKAAMEAKKSKGRGSGGARGLPSFLRYFQFNRCISATRVLIDCRIANK
jgi:hypothetical protein